MSIDKFQPPSDMARVLLVLVSPAEFNAIVEGKICVVFVPYNSDWKDSKFSMRRLVLTEKKSACLGSMISYSFIIRTPYLHEYFEDGAALA